MTTIIDEQGHFSWYRDPPLKNNSLNNVVTGRLKIERDGSVKLDLDGTLPSDKHILERVLSSRNESDETYLIYGILKTTKQHVLLLDAVRDGGQMNFIGYTYEKFRATKCLIGSESFPLNRDKFAFSAFEIKLRGFEEWLNLRPIEVNSTSRSTTARSKSINLPLFDIGSGRLGFRHRTDYLQSHSGHEVSITDVVTLWLRPKRAFTLDQLHRDMNSMQDLMVLLTDSHYSLEWPQVQLTRCKAWHTLYFWRTPSSAAPPRWHEMPVAFNLIKNQFGLLFTNWQGMIKKFGAGVYSFIATKRDVKMYVESTFLTLASGLESFHRVKFGDHAPLNALQEKIDRILNGMPEGKDKKWLKIQLRHKAEPSLAERLFELFSRHPLLAKKSGLRDFAVACAGIRNDLAHHGGNGTRHKSSNYLMDIESKNYILSIVYHELLLREVGVGDDAINNWLYRGPRSYGIKHALKQAGL